MMNGAYQATNVYLDAFEEFAATHRDPWAVEWYEKRRQLVRYYAWAIPNDDAINEIAAHSPIIEVGAGTGYWASLLRHAGATVYAYDKFPPNQANNPHGHSMYWAEVERCRGPKHAVENHGSECSLLLCWPPLKESMAYTALKNYRGNRVFYVGEGPYGCTADKKFHDLLYAEWDHVKTVFIPRWPSINDSLFVYTRKECADEGDN